MSDFKREASNIGAVNDEQNLESVHCEAFDQSRHELEMLYITATILTF